METLYPTSYTLDSSLYVQEKQSTYWTKEENKKFESALAIYDKDAPDRWLKVAAMIPGKTVLDVIRQYMKLEEDVCDIEAGRIPVPGYLGDSFSMDLVGGHAYRKTSLGVRNSEHERKKGVPWTEDEHRRFLMGLVKYGKGDWRNISRNFVITKNPTQVASHAQKYFLRQLPGGKDKKRPSIHDITTLSLTESALSNNHNHALLDQSKMLPLTRNSAREHMGTLNWSQPNEISLAVLQSTYGNGNGNRYMKSSHDISDGLAAWP